MYWLFAYPRSQLNYFKRVEFNIAKVGGVEFGRVQASHTPADRVKWGYYCTPDYRLYYYQYASFEAATHTIVQNWRVRTKTFEQSTGYKMQIQAMGVTTVSTFSSNIGNSTTQHTIFTMHRMMKRNMDKCVIAQE